MQSAGGGATINALNVQTLLKFNKMVDALITVGMGITLMQTSNAFSATVTVLHAQEKVTLTPALSVIQATSKSTLVFHA